MMSKQHSMLARKGLEGSRGVISNFGLRIANFEIIVLRFVRGSGPLLQL